MPPVFQLYRFSDEDVVWWRLVSPNGRGIARTTVALPTSAAARESVDAVRASIGTLVPMLRLTETYRWQWFLTSNDAPVVQGIGDQDRRVRCADSCRAFVLLAPVAQVDPVVVTYRRVTSPRISRRATP